LLFKQESECETQKCFGIEVYSAKAGMESKSNILDSAHYCPRITVVILIWPSKQFECETPGLQWNPLKSQTVY